MIADGWLDWATRIDGVPDKVYSQPNSGYGIACHSVVGREADFQDGIPNRFLSTEKTADGRYTEAAAASCMFVLRESGELIQMYPVTTSTWTSGGREANTSFWAIEAEGGLFPNYGEQLTPAAEESFIRLVTEWENHTGLGAFPNANILQHSQIATTYGYAPTACASGRYETAWSRIAAGERYAESLSLSDKQRLDRLESFFSAGIYPVVASDGNKAALEQALGHPAQVGQVCRLTGEETLVYNQAQGNNFALGLLLTQQALRDVASELNEVAVWGSREGTAEIVAKLNAIVAGIDALDQNLDVLG